MNLHPYGFLALARHWAPDNIFKSSKKMNKLYMLLIFLGQRPANYGP